MAKPLKITLIVVACLLVAVFALGLIAGNYLYTLALVPGGDKSVVFEADHNAVAFTNPGQEATRQWAETHSYEELWIHSTDELELHGYLYQNTGHLWAIACHGYSSSGMDMVGFARHFYEMGFGVLTPDARGCGESEGDYIGMGWHDRLDVMRWIDYIVAQDPEAEILLYGISMGGATVMMTAGEALPSNVKAVVEDCGYSSIKDELSYQLKQLFGLPAFPLIHFSSLVAKMRAGFFLGDGDARKQVAKAEVPIFFIHGSEDTFVPSYMVQEVYEAANAEKQLMVVEGAGHGQASDIDDARYWAAVEEFVGRYIPLPETAPTGQVAPAEQEAPAEQAA